MATFTLENATLRLELDRDNGALVGLTTPGTGWRILDRPRLGLSFRLLVPLSEDLRNNPVHGEKQPLAEPPELASDGRGATLVWDNLASERGGVLPIRLTVRITLDERRAVYAMTVENRSLHVVENVYCPYLGDVQHPAGAEWLKAFSYNYATAQEWPLWPKFQNMRGYYGVDHPTQLGSWAAASGAPMSPYILLRSQDQGLYAGVCAPSAELVAWHADHRRLGHPRVDGTPSFGPATAAPSTRGCPRRR
jgi:hypothetical protein